MFQRAILPARAFALLALAALVAPGAAAEDATTGVVLAEDKSAVLAIENARADAALRLGAIRTELQADYERDVAAALMAVKVEMDRIHAAFDAEAAEARSLFTSDPDLARDVFEQAQQAAKAERALALERYRQAIEDAREERRAEFLALAKSVRADYEATVVTAKATLDERGRSEADVRRAMRAANDPDASSRAPVDHAWALGVKPVYVDACRGVADTGDARVEDRHLTPATCAHVVRVHERVHAERLVVADPFTRCTLFLAGGEAGGSVRVGGTEVTTEQCEAFIREVNAGAVEQVDVQQCRDRLYHGARELAGSGVTDPRERAFTPEWPYDALCVQALRGGVPVAVDTDAPLEVENPGPVREACERRQEAMRGMERPGAEVRNVGALAAGEADCNYFLQVGKVDPADVHRSLAYWKDACVKLRESGNARERVEGTAHHATAAHCRDLVVFLEKPEWSASYAGITVRVDGDLTEDEEVTATACRTSAGDPALIQGSERVVRTSGCTSATADWTGVI